MHALFVWPAVWFGPKNQTQLPDGIWHWYMPTEAMTQERSSIHNCKCENRVVKPDTGLQTFKLKVYFYVAFILNFHSSPIIHPRGVLYLSHGLYFFT